MLIQNFKKVEDCSNLIMCICIDLIILIFSHETLVNPLRAAESVFNLSVTNSLKF